MNTDTRNIFVKGQGEALQEKVHKKYVLSHCLWLALGITSRRMALKMKEDFLTERSDFQMKMKLLMIQHLLLQPR